MRRPRRRRTSYGPLRKRSDVNELTKMNFEVEPDEGRPDMITVKFYAPEGTIYTGGVWDVRFKLPDDFPYKPPLVKFVDEIFHPNVAETSGIVCADVLGAKWIPTYRLWHILEYILPQLLSEPNPDDPANAYASALFIIKPEVFEEKVKDLIRDQAPPNGSGRERSAGNEDELVEDISETTDSAASSVGSTIHPGSAGLATQPGSDEHAAQPGSYEHATQPGSDEHATQPGD